MLSNNSQTEVEGFTDFINLYINSLNSYAAFSSITKDKRYIFNTFFLGKTHSVTSRLEEVLDHYNAKNNMDWAPFRENISTIKLFTNISYITLHLKSASPRYKLLSGIDVFLNETDQVLDSFCSALKITFHDYFKIAKKNGLNYNLDKNTDLNFFVEFPDGRLESNLKKRTIDSPEKVIVNLATSYLNLASESDLLEYEAFKDVKNYSQIVPDVVNENKLRILENKFHNLQSLYDTYIANSDIEDLDSDLRLIRGHASIVYHLLEASTRLVHYYERHMMSLSGGKEKLYKPPISTKGIFGLLFNYYINYAEQFLNGGVKLCRNVIKKYAEEGSIVVKVPGYRGFHVRPSTLVSKIVQHYGSEVYMIVGDQKYNAALPMDLFRVNEKINAEKRRSLAENICSLHSSNDPDCVANFDKGLKEIFHELLEENKIINYSTDFSLPGLKPFSEETLGEFANRAIAFLLAQGKIDLKTDLKVTFQGDKRVLADLEILANCGYGEDSHGNNVVLPKELSYIRR